MFKPLEAFVGLRYLRARSRNHFISFITLASMLGIAVGVAALIVIISVMNGFETELRGRLLSMTAHAMITGEGRPLDEWRSVVAAAEADDAVEAAAPYVRLQAMLARGRELQGAEVRGVRPDLERDVSEIGRFMVQGTLEGLAPGGDGIVLGRLLALRLGLEIGSEIDVLVPQIVDAGIVRPRLRAFRVVGFFEAGVQEHDTGLALIDLDTAAALAGHPDAVTGVRLRLADLFDAPRVSARVAEAASTAAGRALRATDWTRENATYFRAIRLEKTMMATMLLLVVAVAAFNIVASLVMVVTEKRTDVAILRTLGLAPERVTRIFMLQGSVIGVLGTGLGVAAGLAMALNVETIVPWLESTFGFQIMPGDVYYVTNIPSETHAGDVVLIAFAGLVLGVLATVYPSRRAGRVAPAEALRYD